jgi:hypothetical protein
VGSDKVPLLVYELVLLVFAIIEKVVNKCTLKFLKTHIDMLRRCCQWLARWNSLRRGLWVTLSRHAPTRWLGSGRQFFFELFCDTESLCLFALCCFLCLRGLRLLLETSVIKTPQYLDHLFAVALGKHPRDGQFFRHLVETANAFGCKRRQYFIRKNPDIGERGGRVSSKEGAGAPATKSVPCIL